MIKKNLRDVKNAMVQHRLTQSTERSKDLELNQIINPDKENDNFLGLYSKGMTHDSTTWVCDESKIKEIQIALNSGDQKDFDDIDKAGARKQASPQAALSFENSGSDPEGLTMPAPYALNSREAAAEMVEVYAHALLRDVPFSSYESGSQDLTDALNALNAFGDDFKGPKENGSVTLKTLFRGSSVGSTVGGYVSQLLLHPIGVGNFTIQPKGPTKTGVYGNTGANYLSIQNGNVPVAQTIDATERFIYNGRQLGSTVHIDLVFQHFYEAAAVLLNAGVGRNAAFPTLANEGAFVTNGGPVEITTGVAEVSRHALKAAWVQKWRKHLRLRPEAMAARVVAEIAGLIPSGTVHADLINSAIITKVSDFNINNGGEADAFLPLQYAEGSPTHPSYPAGHATIAGACATLLKIYFADGLWSTTGLSELQATTDGLATEAYPGMDAGTITIHGEINKLADNIAIGRDYAGVHYRSDSELALGEKVAIEYFKDIRSQQNENIGEVTLTKFDGTTVQI